MRGWDRRGISCVEVMYAASPMSRIDGFKVANSGSARMDRIMMPPFLKPALVGTVGALAVLALTVLAAQTPGPESALVDRAHKLLKEVPLIDGHNDLCWAMRENAGYDFDK